MDPIISCEILIKEYYNKNAIFIKEAKRIIELLKTVLKDII